MSGQSSCCKIVIQGSCGGFVNTTFGMCEDLAKVYLVASGSSSGHGFLVTHLISSSFAPVIFVHSSEWSNLDGTDTYCSGSTLAVVSVGVLESSAGFWHLENNIFFWFL